MTHRCVESNNKGSCLRKKIEASEEKGVLVNVKDYHSIGSNEYNSSYVRVKISHTSSHSTVVKLTKRILGSLPRLEAHRAEGC